eukprot:292945-Pelagomonas_calceolata.AAC.1
MGGHPLEMPAQACTRTAAAPTVHQGLAFGMSDGMGLGAYSVKVCSEQWKLVKNELSRASVNGARLKNSKKLCNPTKKLQILESKTVAMLLTKEANTTL